MANASPSVLMVSYFMPPYFFAGAGNQAALLARELADQGVVVSMLTSLGAKGWMMMDDLDGIPVFLLRGSRHNPLLNFILFNLLSIVWAILHASTFDVVHIHGCPRLSTLIWVPLARLLGKKVLLKITCSGVDDLPGIRKTPLLGTLAFCMAKQADGYVALTSDIAEGLRQFVPERKIFQIANGFDHQRFFPVELSHKQDLRQQLGLPLDKLLLVYIGGMNPRKNILFLLDSLSKLRQRYDNVALCLVGPCKEKFQGYGQQIRERIEALGLNDAVFLENEVPYSEVPRYIQASDIFVFASSQEGLPSSPIEAMACGLPSVVLSLPGVTDWLYEGNDQALVVDGDISEFVEAVSKLIDLPARRQAMSQNAASYAKKRFQSASIARYYLQEVYPTLLNKTPILSGKT